MICKECLRKIKKDHNGNWYHIDDNPPYHIPIPKERNEKCVKQ